MKVQDFWNTTEGWLESEFITTATRAGNRNQGRTNVDTTLPVGAFSPRTDISILQFIPEMNLDAVYDLLQAAENTIK